MTLEVILFRNQKIEEKIKILFTFALYSFLSTCYLVSLMDSQNYFGVFISVPHLVDNNAKIVDERSRNLICDCTLPSLLVYFITNITKYKDTYHNLRYVVDSKFLESTICIFLPIALIFAVHNNISNFELL